MINVVVRFPLGILADRCQNVVVLEDPERCYQACLSRDARFDGWFFIGVSSTGIYCRPSCPAQTAKRENARFYATAASAQQAGLRACRRCRPDATPGSPEWNVRADVVARAMRLIRDGIVDREGVGGLARRLGYSVRQIDRLVTAEIGIGPLALVRAQRIQTARILLETTDLNSTDIAFAAGFASARRLNETIREVFADSPSGLRHSAPGSGSKNLLDRPTQLIQLRLPVRRPFSPASVFQFLSARAAAGIESYNGSTYARSMRLANGYGVVKLTPGELDRGGSAFVNAELYLSDLRDLSTAMARCRQLLDLDADPVAIFEALRGDPVIGELVLRDPGVRVPGAMDGFELTVRAIVGQQVSVEGARTVVGRLVYAAGQPIPQPVAEVTHLFPTPEALILLAEEQPSTFSMPASRRRALVALSEAVRDGVIEIDPGADGPELRRALQALPGIGPWTAEYVAMRVLRDPDAFMPTDLGIRRAAAELGILLDTKKLSDLTDGWRPWRSYAMVHLWSIPIRTRPRATPTEREKLTL